MIFIRLLVLFFCVNVSASMPPNSGKFRNVINEIPPYGAFAKLTSKFKINLIVTESSNGQQFFIQCFIGDIAQPGVTTEFNESRQVTNINAGLGCPEDVVEVELQFEEAIIHVKDGSIYLPHGPIYIP